MRTLDASVGTAGGVASGRRDGGRRRRRARTVSGGPTPVVATRRHRGGEGGRARGGGGGRGAGVRAGARMSVRRAHFPVRLGWPRAAAGARRARGGVADGGTREHESSRRAGAARSTARCARVTISADHITVHLRSRTQGSTLAAQQPLCLPEVPLDTLPGEAGLLCAGMDCLLRRRTADGFLHHIDEFEQSLRVHAPRPIFFGAPDSSSTGRHRKTVASGCLGSPGARRLKNAGRMSTSYSAFVAFNRAHLPMFKEAASSRFFQEHPSKAQPPGPRFPQRRKSWQVTVFHDSSRCRSRTLTCWRGTWQVGHILLVLYSSTSTVGYV